MLIYIAGPVTEGGKLSLKQAEKNLKLFREAIVDLITRGHTPVCTAIPYLEAALVAKEEYDLVIPEDRWLNMSIDVLQRCDGIYCFAKSLGSEIERFAAIRHHIQVFISLDEIPTGNYLRDKRSPGVSDVGRS